MLYVSPMSIEICEVVAQLTLEGWAIGITATKNQIGPSSYTGLRKPRHALLHSDIVFERDHLESDCESLEEVIEFIESDADDLGHSFQYGFMLDGRFDNHEVLSALARTFTVTSLQCGPGERGAAKWAKVAMDAAQGSCCCFVKSVSGPTGMRIAPDMRTEACLDEIELLRTFHSEVRVHNSDYWLRDMQPGTSYNIGPELATIQSAVYMGRELLTWQSACLSDHKQRGRWCSREAKPDTVCQTIGHYHYNRIHPIVRHDLKDRVKNAVHDRLLGILRTSPPC